MTPKDVEDVTVLDCPKCKSKNTLYRDSYVEVVSHGQWARTGCSMCGWDEHIRAWGPIWHEATSRSV